MSKKEVRKCYSCRKPVEGKNLFCKDCEKKPEARKSTMSTFKGKWHNF